MRTLSTDARPDVIPAEQSRFLERPRKSPFIGCWLCILPKWTTWKCTAGQTDTIRTHLQKEHPKEWRETVILKQLKGWEELSGLKGPKQRHHHEPFTKEGFLRCLIAWLVIDDQSINVVDGEEFRELLLYVGDANLEDIDIPHRTLISKLLTGRYQEARSAIATEARIGMITLDNVSNCGTMMEELERLLREKGIPFDRDGNRIRCFPHVVNISVQTGLKQLTTVDPLVYADDTVSTDDMDAAASNPALLADMEYMEALREDPVSKARSLITVCRASQQRREDFDQTIIKGNIANTFGQQPLQEVQLLKDVDTRWSSSFMMIDQVLELYQAVDIFLLQPKQEAIAWHTLSRKTLEVLNDIREFLEAPHAVQELLSAEQTPTLSLTLPCYEKLIVLLKLLRCKLMKIVHAITASIEKLEEYLTKSRKTRIYAIAIIINPSMKFIWLSNHWSAEDVAAARQWICDSMLEYRKQLRANHQAVNSVLTQQDPHNLLSLKSDQNSTSHTSMAAHSQQSSIRRINALIKALSTDNVTTPGTELTSIPQTGNEGELIDIKREEAEQQACKHDRLVVEAKLRKYEKRVL
ncbi:hypothetical protein AcV5_003286 [Taiwanofungus camphoratus]|nr:hypothetical protein AcV5_003286 [Antrodia cinnamomea]